MQDLAELRRFFENHPAREDLILCTVVAKRGSNYRGVGAKKWVSRDSLACGVLSGGCLEASIEKLARESAVHDFPFLKSFSTISEDDRLMGYQTGCHGNIDVLFERAGSRELDLLIPAGQGAPRLGVSVRLKGADFGLRTFGRADSSEEFFFEPWVHNIHLVLIGAGLDGLPFIPLARMMNWDLSEPLAKL